MTGYTQFSREQLNQGFELFNDFYHLSIKALNATGALTERGDVNAADLFKQVLAIMQCSSDELNILWALLNCASNVTLQASNDALFEGLDQLLPRRPSGD
jgi:hypothetical protein